MNERVTFAAQDSLPQLPVPDLSGTLQRYVKSVESLLTAEEFEKTKALAADFERTDGPMLQKLLEQQAEEASKRKGPTVVLDENHPDGSAYPNSHWLEGWWEKYAYLSDRVPLLVNVNCFQSHFRATTCPKPLTRAAWSIKGGLDSVRLLQQELVPPDRAGKAVFCSAQYHRVYNTTRIPGEAIDEIHTYSSSKHIAVQRRGHWYVIHDALGMSPSEIERQLAFIKQDAAGREAGPYVAAFTGVERTSWAKARQGLLRLDPTNIETLWWIESAIFHVSLSEESPTTPNEVQELGMCGRNDIWFDKNGTHVVFENGAMITNLEHASADAVVPARLYCYMDEFVQQNAPELGITEGQGAKALLAGVSGIPVTKYQEGDESTNEQRARPGRLDFVLDGALKQALSKAQEEVKALLKDNAVECLDFQDFGGKTISKTCKGVSTDSFVQMSLALAYYRDQGEMPVTYETATTRSFFHGRTETIRPQSLAMREFVQGFDTGKISEDKLADLIREAANAHRNYLRSCMGGQGVDRHLMGLRILAAERGMPIHPLFEDKAYVKSTSHTLSTSQMPIALSDWPGFGAYSSNAYGTCYRFTFEDTIVATVSSRKVNSGNKNAKRFSEAIKQAFRDVKRVLEANPPAPKAKL